MGDAAVVVSLSGGGGGGGLVLLLLLLVASAGDEAYGAEIAAAPLRSVPSVWHIVAKLAILLER